MEFVVPLVNRKVNTTTATTATKLASTRTFRQTLSNTNDKTGQPSLPRAFSTALPLSPPSMRDSRHDTSAYPRSRLLPDSWTLGRSDWMDSAESSRRCVLLRVRHWLAIKTTPEYYRSGAAGMISRIGQIPNDAVASAESTQWKRNGRLPKSMSRCGEEKIQEHGRDFILCTRTDARSVSSLEPGRIRRNGNRLRRGRR
ncbi:hypothetical protein ACHAWF_009630 [Thalassiosira exigua]